MFFLAIDLPSDEASRTKFADLRTPMMTTKHPVVFVPCTRDTIRYTWESVLERDGLTIVLDLAGFTTHVDHPLL